MQPSWQHITNAGARQVPVNTGIHSSPAIMVSWHLSICSNVRLGSCVITIYKLTQNQISSSVCLAVWLVRLKTQVLEQNELNSEVYLPSNGAWVKGGRVSIDELFVLYGTKQTLFVSVRFPNFSQPKAQLRKFEYTVHTVFRTRKCCVYFNKILIKV